MSKFLEKIGDYNGPLTYTAGATNVIRSSKNDQSDQLEDTTVVFPGEEPDSQLAGLYTDYQRVLRMKENAELRLEAINREASAMEAALGGWTPPPPPPEEV